MAGKTDIQYADETSTAASSESQAKVHLARERTSTWSPAVLQVVGDFIFFFNYLFGWYLTSKYQPEMIWNNNVTRIFFVYNICIGVDTYPAQPVALLIFVLFFLIYSASVFVLWQLVNLKGSFRSKVVRKVLLGAALFFSGTFFLTYGVRPDNPLLTAIHTWGFAGGLFGYVLFHASLLLEYFVIGNEKPKTCKTILYVLTVLLTTAFYMFMVYVLVQALLTKPINDWAATIDSGVIPATVTGGTQVFKPAGLTSAYIMIDGKKQPISVGVRSWILVLVVAISPLAQYCFMPDTMKVNVEFTPHVRSDTAAKEDDMA